MEYTDRVKLNNDGVYRWYCDVDMRRGSRVLRTLMIVMGIIGTLIAGILAVMMISDRSMSNTSVLLIVLGIYAIVFGVGIFSYLLMFLIQRGVCRYSYEMSEEGIFLHTFQTQQAVSSVANAVEIAGALTGHRVRNARPSDENGYTPYKSVRKVLIDRERNALYLKALIGENYVYTSSEDYEFVKEFILRHLQSWRPVVEI